MCECNAKAANSAKHKSHAGQRETDCYVCNDHKWLIWRDKNGNGVVKSCENCNKDGKEKPPFLYDRSAGEEKNLGSTHNGDLARNCRVAGMLGVAASPPNAN